MHAADPMESGNHVEVDNIGIVPVQDGPSLLPGEIIAPAVAPDADDPNYHNNYQDAEAFLAAGGRRGRQYVPLTDGTYFINRWFASVELIPKTVVPIGYVGVVVSYYGRQGQDVTGTGRDPTLWRREEVDHANARPDAERVLPRHRSYQDDARVTARA